MPTSHLDIYAQVIPLRFSIYQSAVKTALQFEGKDLVLPCREGWHTVRGWYLLAVFIGSRKLFCTSILFFPAALVFLSVGIREVVQMCVLALHWLLEGIVLPITFMGLGKKCNDTSSLMLG